LAFGGIYVAGGIAVKILPKMKDGTFVRAFCAKGGFASILARVPIHVVLNEDAPLWGRPPGQFAPILTALRELERRTLDAKGLVLRFGHLYGPGSAYAPDGWTTQQVRAGQFPIAGRGESVFSFTHADDAASAVVAALRGNDAGILNIVDDEPISTGQWLPGFAALVGAPAPRHVPAALVRVAAGGWGAAFMTQLRGASNARAKAALGWQPRYRTWLEGFASMYPGQPHDS